MNKFGECDFEDCPHLKDGACTYHPKKCFIDEKEKGWGITREEDK